MCALPILSVGTAVVSVPGAFAGIAVRLHEDRTDLFHRAIPAVPELAGVASGMGGSSVRRHHDPAVPAQAARGAAADRAAQGRPSLWRTPATVHQPDHRNDVLGAARPHPTAVTPALRANIGRRTCGGRR